MNIEEIRIPAPWGEIAVKAWGDRTNEAIIVTHGYQDNAGSFDRLIPMLPTCFYYICVDLPGHGFSTRFHDSMPLHYINFLLPYTIVVNYFKRNKYILMGHSFGGTLSVVFAQLYPNRVSKLILLDAVYVKPMDPNSYLNMVEYSHGLYLKAFEEQNIPKYSYEEIIKKIQNGRQIGYLTYETAEDLAKRMIKSVGHGKYVFTIDRKIKGLILPNSTEKYHADMFEAKPVKCPTFIYLTPNNEYAIQNAKLLQRFKQTGFAIKKIYSHHHVHQTHPEMVANDIAEFLLSKQTKL